MKIKNQKNECGVLLKITIIGPVKPFRGGIAHSTNTLCNNLSRNNEVRAISFSRLYPKFLYPGKEQRENGEPEKGMDAKFIIDSINPFSWIGAFSEIKKQAPERVLFIWWHPFFFPCYFTIALMLRVFSKARVGCLCHNVVPHERSTVDKILAKMFFMQMHYIVTYAESNLQIIKEMLPKKDAKFVSESLYESQFSEVKIGKREAREKIGVEKDCVLFFGMVRKYKGLDYLLEAMPEILKKKDLTLVIAGEFWGDKDEYIEKIERLGISEKVEIIGKYIDSGEVPVYFKAADAVILPYVSSTSSAVLQLAFVLNTPVITTAVGGNVDFIKDGINGLLVPPENSEKLAEAVIRFYNEGLEKKFRERMLKDKKLFEWDDGKEKIFLDKA